MRVPARFATALLFASGLAAQTLTLHATLEATQVVPPNLSPGTGRAVVTVDRTTGAVSVSGVFSGLTSAVQFALIHGIAARGVNAGVILGVSSTLATAGTFTGSGTLTPTQLAGMLGGNTYLILHTQMFAAGEIRGQIDMPNVSLEQVDFDMDATGPSPILDTEYGHLRLAIQTPSPPGLVFVNMVARNATTASPPTWLLQNMPIPGNATTGLHVLETGQVVDLRPLGIVRGISAVGNVVQWRITTSPTPVPAQPTFAPDRATTIGEITYSHGIGISTTPRFPKLDPPLALNAPAWNGDTTAQIVWNRNFPNIEQEDDESGPAALTNSMHWMASTYPGQIQLGGPPRQTTAQTLAKFRTYTNFQPVQYHPVTGRITQHSGITSLDTILGKLKFITDNTKTFPPNMVVRYQADRILNLDQVNVAWNGKIARRIGDGSQPTFAFLLGELSSGADVEMWIDWLDNAGAYQGSHLVSAVGAFRFGNRLFVWTNDDAKQGRLDGTGAPPDNGGLRTAHCHQITIENGGYMRLSGFRMNNRVTAIYSEEIPPGALGNVLPYGIGCPQPNPLTLSALDSSAPVPDTELVLGMSNLPPNSLAGALLFGFSQISIPLGSIGATNCTLLQAGDVSLSVPTPAARVSIRLGPDVGGVGLSIEVQGAVIAPGVNPFGAAFSNGLVLTIGY